MALLMPMSDVFSELSRRGLVHQTTDQGLAKLLAEESLTAYIGFDPTADSLHVGHLQQICTLRRLQEFGHRPIALVGGGTGMIGDPTFKSEERVLLSPEQLEVNKQGIGAQLARFIDFEGGKAVFEDNARWLAPAGLLEFLRDVGKHFSVNEMVRKDSVRPRLTEREQSLSYTEFSYMLLQAWDFVNLFDLYGCRLQLGGSDQYGNIAEGVGLLRRLRQVHGFGLTSPLVTKADGTKFGKTAGGAVWLDPAKTSPYEFFQFWLGTADAEVIGYLQRFSFRSQDEIAELAAEVKDHPERRGAQRELARELTAMVHGPGAAAQAERAGEALFTEEIAALDPATLASALAGAPRTEVERAQLADGLALVELLKQSGLASSNRDARQHLANGAISVNNVRVAAERDLGTGDIIAGRFVVLRRGRRHQHVIEVRG